MNSVLIVGYGTVGSNMNKLFTKADIHDPRKHYFASERAHYNVGFICVPTDLKADKTLDTSSVEEAIERWKSSCEVLCIRSTVPIGFTRKHPGCVFQPEYYGATKHANAKDFNFIVLGGLDGCLMDIIVETYKEVTSAYTKFAKVDPETAELAKFMENSWIAMKVTFCNEFFRVASLYDVDYDVLREIFLLDPRVSPSHTYVYRKHAFYDSHCLNKDIPHISTQVFQDHGYLMALLRRVMSTNTYFKNEHESTKARLEEPDGMC
jgi:UDPglucose 6-dehydrogenase